MMKCPICQSPLANLFGNKKGCPNSSMEPSGHCYHNSTTNDFFVESYIYRGWRIHTAPIHPVLGIPLTSFYRVDYQKGLPTPGYDNTPDYEVESYMTSDALEEAIDMVSRDYPASGSASGSN